MSICSRIAPSLMHIKDPDSSHLDGQGCIKKFPYHLQSYVSQVEKKIYPALMGNWNFRAAIVGWTVLKILSIPFHLIEATLAGIAAFFALLQTRDPNNSDFRHLTCWTTESARETGRACFAPIGAIFLFHFAGTMKRASSDFFFVKSASPSLEEKL